MITSWNKFDYSGVRSDQPERRPTSSDTVTTLQRRRTEICVLEARVMTVLPSWPDKIIDILQHKKGHMVESPSSRFTAVNGREASASGFRSNGDAGGSPSSASDRAASSGAPDGSSPRRISQERSRVSTTHHDWYRNGVDSSDRPGGSSGPHHHHQHMRSVDGASSHKRIRTESPERRNSSTHSYPQPVFSRSPPHNMSHSGETTGPDYGRPSPGPDGSRHGSYSAAPLSYAARHEEGSDNDRGNGRYYTQMARSMNDSDRADPQEDVHATEIRLAEALRRESAHVDSMDRRSRSRTAGSHDGDTSRGQSRPADPAASESTPTTGIQVDHRRRKRVFSNRTKTGCLTCRRRKKKCDELKPECAFTIYSLRLD